MSTRTGIAILISTMVNAVLFGIGAVTVLSVPALASKAALLLPVTVIASFALTPFIAWSIAPHMRARAIRIHDPE